MRKKINRINALILIVTMSFIVVLSSFLNYNFQKDNELKWIKTNLMYISNIKREKNDFSSYIDLKKLDSNIRITLLNLDGNVLFDTDKDVKNMENHKDRKEIKDAINDKLGYEKRDSKTLGYKTIYFSTKTINNEILRISTEVRNVFYVFNKVLFWDVLIVVVAIFLSMCLTKKLTKEIFEPIMSLANNLDDFVFDKKDFDVNVYKELVPFVRCIKNQKKEILSYIDNIKDKNSMIENIILNMNEGLMMVDDAKKIVLYNKAMVKLFNKNENIDYTNRSLEYFIGDETNYKKIEDFILNKNNKTIEISKNDRSLKIYFTKNDKTFIFIVLDITDEKNLSKIRREFSANVSHELKSPLTSIMGYSEMILNGIAKDKDIKNFSNIIFEKSKKLLNMINDIIKLSKLDEGDVYGKNEIFNISESVLKLEKFMENEKRKKNITFINSFKENFFVNKNKIFVESVLENLISNAIKYNKENGKVEIKIDKLQGYDFIVEIKDTGIGIENKELKRIFERFYIVDKARTLKDNSTGLGLSIVKSMMNLLNGEIEIISKLNEFTKVILKFKKNI